MMDPRKCLAHLISLKVLLISSFIILMAIAGFLGYALTNIQSQKSLNDMAEVNVYDMAYSVRSLIETRIAVCHQLNLQEYYYFRHRQLNITDWANAYYQWLPLTIDLTLPFKTSITTSGLLWLPNFAISPSLFLNIIQLIDFNKTVCNDTTNFFGSDCSIGGLEQYRINPTTFAPIWKMISNVPNFPMTQQTYWKTGVMARMDGRWTQTEANPINFGYAAISPFMQVSPPVLNLQVNAGIFTKDGVAYGQIFKSILLNFIGVFLQNMTSQHKLLSQNGRAFSFEIGNSLLTGASHGNIYSLQNGVVNRFTPQQSDDAIIASAGRVLVDAMQGKTFGGATSPELKLKFSAVGKDFLCVGDPLIDAYGLQWMTSVVLSLTDLFRDINDAAMRMLGWTALAIISLSIIAGLIISFVVTRPLDVLSTQMGIVADMDLESVDPSKSRLFEIATMQTYFHKMVANLKEFRTFLPEAILGGGAAVDSVNGDEPEPSPTSHNDLVAKKPAAGEDGAQTQRTQTTAVSYAKKGDPARASDAASEESAGSSHREGRTSTQDRPHQHRRKSRHVNKQVGALTRRTVSTLLVDVKGFHKFVGQEELLMSMHTTVMQRVTDVVQANAGMCSPFMGDKVLVYWNVRNVKSDHAILCVTSAMQIYTQFRQDAAANPKEDSVEKEVACPVYLACTTGTAVFGTFGTQTSRAFTVVSTSITRGTHLHKMAKLIPLGVVCDGPMYERVQFTFTTRLVSFFSFPDRSTNFHVYEVLGAKGAAETDEWMYELKQQENAAGVGEAEFTMGVRACFSGDPAAAQRHFKTHLLHRKVADPTALWFLTNAEHLKQLLHPIWGLSLPLIPGDAPTQGLLKAVDVTV